MYIIVTSDTHGELDKFINSYNHIKDNLVNPDMIIHLGDYARDAQDLTRILNTDIISIKGNCDGGYGTHAHMVLPTEGGNLYLSHGHQENVKMTYQSIYYRAQEQGCCAALFGHTHRAIFQEAGSVMLLNPGSISFPSDGSSGTLAILKTTAEGLDARILHYSEMDSWEAQLAGFINAGATTESGEGTDSGNNSDTTQKKAKVQGGYLRGLLNYSDRF